MSGEIHNTTIHTNASRSALEAVLVNVEAALGGTSKRGPLLKALDAKIDPAIISGFKEEIFRHSSVFDVRAHRMLSFQAYTPAARNHAVSDGATG